MKIITLLPVKNESWVLDFSLKNFSLFSDEIIVLNDNSTDNSCEIAAKYPKVKVLNNDAGNKEVNMSQRRQSLLDAGREAGGTHFIFLDADETFTTDFIDQIKSFLEKMKPGDTLLMPWLLLFKENNKFYYNQSKAYLKDFIFCDDKKSNFRDLKLSEERTPISNGNKIQLSISDGAVLHFQQIANLRNQYKQIWYRCNEYIEGKRSAKKINATYEFTKTLKLKNKQEIADIFTIENQYLIDPRKGEVEPLERVKILFDKFGVEYFEPLDIWHTDETLEIFKQKVNRDPKIQTFPKILIKINDKKNKIKNFFPSSGVKLYLENISWSFFTKIVSLVVSLITTALIARMLGPTAFGLLNYIISFGAVISVFVNLGIDNVIYKHLTEEKHKTGEILGTGLALKFIAGLVALFLINIISYTSSETDYVKLLIIVFSVSYITQPLNLLLFHFLAERKSKVLSIIQIISLILVNILKIAVIYFYKSLALFILIQSLEAALTGVLALYFIKKNYKLNSFKFSKTRAKTFVNFIIPLTLFSVFSEIYYKIDILMLRHMQNVTTVGLYSAAVRLTEVWYFISTIAASTLFPALVSAFNLENKREYYRRLKTLGYALFAASLVLISSTIISGEILIKIIYGDMFIGSLPILYIYIFSLPGSLLLGIIYQDRLLHNKLWQITLIAFVPAIINFILNLLLIPTHGAAGAALATVISYNCITLYFLYYINKNRENF